MTPLAWLVMFLAAVPVVWLWIYAIGDLTRRTDISISRRWLWIAGVVFLPLIGALLYLIYRPARPDDIRGFGRAAGRRRPPTSSSD